MSVCMAERIRMVLLVSDEVRAGLKLEAAKQDMEMSELAEEILRQALRDSIEEVRLREARKAQGKRKGVS